MQLALISLALGSTTLAFAPASAGGEDLPAPQLVLPDGAAAKAWAQVSADTPPAALDWGAAGAPTLASWEAGATWSAWSQALASAAREPNDVTARARLCLLAKSQGRDQDAWRHFAALVAEPSHAAAAASYLFPGVPLDSELQAGGLPPALPDGTILTPSVPPLAADAPSPLVLRSMHFDGVRVGEATLGLDLEVSNSGVEVTVRHLSGGAALVGVLMPRVEGFPFYVEYIDWMRQDELGEPLVIEVQPGDEEHAFFARFREERATVPTRIPEHLPATIVRGGLWFDFEGSDQPPAFFAQLQQAFAQLLDVRVELHSAATGTRIGGQIIRVPSGPERAARLRYLAASVERFVLAQ